MLIHICMHVCTYLPRVYACVKVKVFSQLLHTSLFLCAPLFVEICKSETISIPNNKTKTNNGSKLLCGCEKLLLFDILTMFELFFGGVVFIFVGNWIKSLHRLNLCLLCTVHFVVLSRICISVTNFSRILLHSWHIYCCKVWTSLNNFN